MRLTHAPTTRPKWMVVVVVEKIEFCLIGSKINRVLPKTSKSFYKSVCPERFMTSRNKLNPRSIPSLPPGKHGDGAGLWLYKRENGGAQWVARVTVNGKRREMGLGPYPDVSLSEARANAADARKIARSGKDPIREREKQKRDARRDQHIFRDVALEAYETKKAELKDDGKAGGWFSPLENHIIPKLGNTPIREIDQLDIRDALLPIWHDMASTAEKALYRTSIVLQHAAALGLTVNLQAPALARALLGAQRHEVEHIEAMPLNDVPGFYASLEKDIPKHLALRLLILTGVRSKPIRFMTADQVSGNVWTIPAELMKGKKGKTKEFRVPLSEEALDVIKKAKIHSRNGFLFPNNRGKPMRDQTLSELMSSMGQTARPHGFRSTLRDWLSDVEGATTEVAETCLAHTVGDETERAYLRTDFLNQRRIHMNNWSSFVTGNQLQINEKREE